METCWRRVGEVVEKQWRSVGEVVGKRLVTVGKVLESNQHMLLTIDAVKQHMYIA